MAQLLVDEDTMYNALLQKDSKFEGIFFIGVKTTGIFCRPTCTAKKPKKENVEFFLQHVMHYFTDIGHVKYVIHS